MASPVADRDGCLRVLGHPVHVLLVHIPLGIWPFVFPLEFAAWLGGWTFAWRVAFWANAIALLAALPTVATGMIDFVGGKRGPEAEQVANLHMAAMLGATALFGGEICFHPPGAAIPAPRAFFNLVMALLGSLALLWGGWLGGELVFRHGAGRIGERPRDREGTKT